MNKQEYRKKFIEKYLNQKAALPTDVKAFGEGVFAGQKLVLYGYFDLDDRLKFTEGWILLYETGFCLIENEKVMANIHYDEVADIAEIQSLSCTSFVFVKAHDQTPLGTVRFTFRQKVSMGQVKFLIETFKDGKSTAVKADLDATYAEAVMKPIVEAQNSVSGEERKTLFRLLGYLLPYRKELIWGSVGAITATGLSLVPAFVSGRILDSVVRPFSDGKLDQAEAMQLGLLMVGTLGLTYLLREVAIWLRLKKMSILGEKVAKDLRNELYGHLQELSMEFYSKKQTGSIISRVSADTDRIWDFIAFGVVEVSISVLMLFGLSGMLIFLDWQLGLLMTLPVPLFLAAIYFHGERMNKIFLKAWRKWSNLTNVLSDTIPGVQVVKAFNQEQKENRRFQKKNVDVTDEFNNVHLAWTAFWPKMMGCLQFIFLAVWFLAIPRMISEQPTLSMGVFISFILYMTMFAQPIEVIGQVARMLNRALSSAYRIFEILDTNPTIRNAKDAIRLENIRGDVTFENVYFSYDGVRPNLKNMNFHVKAGEMIGLVGKSGGGKSTITKLISRFYDINDGSIKVDGVDIRDVDCGLLRKQIGIVLQEPYLFHGTIRDNIAYGNQTANMCEVIEAAKTANAHEFIMSLPHSYDTVVGERGHTLSGGERQRVSIARAVLSNPRILILDEATSAVDTETERNIQEALDRLSRGRTVFAIAHRLSTLRQADRIFVVGNGGIVEVGTHAELLTKPEGEYAKLHRMQREMSEAFAL